VVDADGRIPVERAVHRKNKIESRKKNIEAIKTYLNNLHKEGLDPNFQSSDELKNIEPGFNARTLDRTLVQVATQAAFKAALELVDTQPKKKILELGSGKGEFVHLLCPDELKNQIVQSEPHRTFAKEARLKTKQPVKVLSIKQLSDAVTLKRQRRVAVVLAIDVLSAMEVENLDNSISQIKNILSSKGTFLCLMDSPPNFSCISLAKEMTRNEWKENPLILPHLDDKNHAGALFCRSSENSIGTLDAKLKKLLTPLELRYWNVHLINQNSKTLHLLTRNHQLFKKLSTFFKNNIQGEEKIVIPRHYLFDLIQNRLELQGFSVIRNTITKHEQVSKCARHHSYPETKDFNYFVRTPGSLSMGYIPSLTKNGNVLEESAIDYIVATKKT